MLGFLKCILLQYYLDFGRGYKIPREDQNELKDICLFPGERKAVFIVKEEETNTPVSCEGRENNPEE